MISIRIWLAVVGVSAVLALALPTWAEECDYDNGICFGINWKTATVEEIAEVDANLVSFYLGRMYHHHPLGL